jgi:DNA polymerase-3 subunit gamma/tau
MYKAISRRFRPRTFSEVTGQEACVTTLKHALQQKKVAHAYLFSGIRGTGKTTLARILAKALNCDAPKDGFDPCDECSSCQEIAKGQSLNVIEIDGASNRGIEDIRALNETLSYATSEKKFKIFIIDEVHMLTKEAFNALLKPLEEPPSHVKFFFATTELDKVLPTILSRCQRFQLTRIPRAKIMQKLRKVASELSVEIDDASLSFLAKVSEGSLRDAETLFDQIHNVEGPITLPLLLDILGYPAKDDFFALDDAYHTNDLGFAFTLTQKILNSSKNQQLFLESLLEHYRTIALLFFKKDYALNLTPEEEEGYQKALSIYTKEEVLFLLDSLPKILFPPLKPKLLSLHMEMLLLHIIQSKNRLRIDQIIHRLETLQKELPLEKLPPAIAPPKEILLEKVSIAIPKEAPPIENQIMPPLATPSTPSAPSKAKSAVELETLLRFAQVELNGTLTRSK